MAVDIVSHATLKTNLAAYWTLDANFNDSVGSSHGSFVGTPTFPVAKLRTGVKLNGSSQYGSASGTAFTFPGDWTVAFWFYVDTWVNNSLIFSAGNPGSASRVRCYLTNGNKITFYTRQGGIETATTFTTGVWNHVILTCANGENAYFNGYVNNVIDANITNRMWSQGGSAGASDGSMFIGYRPGYSEGYFAGRVDEFGGWHEVISSGERTDLYQGGIGITWDGTFTCIFDHPTLRSGLLAHYKLDGDCNDALGNFNGTPVGSPTYESGKLGQAIKLNGTSQYVDLGTSSVLNPDRISVVAWAKRSNSCGIYGQIVSRRYAGWSYTLGNADTLRIAWAIMIGGGYRLLERDWRDTNWHLFIGTFDGFRVGLSMDGDAFSFGSSVPGVLDKLPTIKTLIGYADSLDGNYFFRDDIDSVSIYDRALFQSEATDLYNSGNGLSYEISTRAPHVKPSGVVLTPASVRVDFDELMSHNDDLIDPDNYIFSGPSTLIPQTVIPVDVGDETRVTITFTGEMQTDGSYHIVASGMVDANDGLPVNPDYDTSDFLGIGVSPWVATASMIGGGPITIDFDELMLHDAALSISGNYALSGPTTITATSATPRDSGGVTHVDLTFTGTITHGGSYQAEVSGVHDLVGNLINPAHDTASFTGVNPCVASASAQDSVTVRVTYNTEMKHTSSGNPDDSRNPTNYVISGPTTAIVSGVMLYQNNPTIVDLTITSEMLNDGDYTVTVSGVKSHDGYFLVIDEAEFTGVGARPRVELATAVGSTVVVVRFNELMLHNDDLTTPGKYTFSGPTVVTVSEVMAEDVNGKTQCSIIVSEPLQRGDYTVTVTAVVDLVGHLIDPAHNSWEFAGVATYAEDMDLTETETDQRLRTPLQRPTQHFCENLRLQLFNVCSHNADPSVRARTILSWAYKTEVRQAVLQVADFGPVAGMQFRQRASLEELFVEDNKLLSLASGALAELQGIDEDTRALLSEYLFHNSRAYNMSAVAAIAVLAVYEEG